MGHIELLSKVGEDGVLRLNVPMLNTDAGREVRVTVEPLSRKAMTQEEWRAFVLKTAGSIADPEFRRHEQGNYEERERRS
jgi:hypothetical protein